MHFGVVPWCGGAVASSAGQARCCAISDSELVACPAYSYIDCNSSERA